MHYSARVTVTSNLRSAVKWLVAFAAIVVPGLLGFAGLGWSYHVPLPFLPAGVAVAAIYRWGRWMSVPVFAGQFIVDLSIHEPLPAVVASAAGMALGPLLSVALLERYRFDANFGRARDVPVFLVAVVVGMALTSVVGVAGFMLAGVPAPSGGMPRWLRWWSNSTAGAWLLAPALVAVSRQSLARFAEHWVEGLIWLTAAALWCAVMLLGPPPTGRSVMIMTAILLVTVGAIRFGLLMSSAGALAISAATVCSFATGHGMFSQFSELSGRLTVFAFSITLVGASLVITALLAERDAAAAARLAAERRYAQIFDGSPQAIWVHDPVTRRFLLANDAAQRQYGWTLPEFLDRDVSALATSDDVHLLPSAQPNQFGGEAYTSPFETRHRTKDGRVLEVEVWMRAIDLAGRPAELVFAVDVTERRMLGKVLIDALAGEQRRIASEIHDGLGQELTGLALSLRALATRAARRQPPAAADLDDLARLAARCIEGSRKIVQGLSPLSDAGGSLESALDSLARRASLSGTPVKFQSQGEARTIASTEALDHFYRIAQEAVQNALKHAAAARIDIELVSGADGVRLSVMDDGRGLPGNLSIRSGLGMRTMQFRAAAIGGSLAIESPRHGGTQVRCQHPAR